MIGRAKSSPTAHAAARSVVAAVKTWAIGALVLAVFLLLRPDGSQDTDTECDYCVSPARHSAAGRE